MQYNIKVERYHRNGRTIFKQLSIVTGYYISVFAVCVLTKIVHETIYKMTSIQYKEETLATYSVIIDNRGVLRCVLHFIRSVSTIEY